MGDTFWYEKWMFGEEANAKRNEAASELLHAITGRHYDTETLENLISILNHELLAWHAKPARRDSDPVGGLLQTAFPRSWTDNVVEILSSCLIKSINETAHFERELQIRALVIALSLLHAQGVESLEDGYYNTLTAQFQDRFRDLNWQPGASGPRSSAKFHKVECAYLLCCASEYARNFSRARPLAVAIIERAKHLLSFGLIAAGPVLGGSINLHNALADLSKVFESLPRRPDDRYQRLFSLQEFTSHAIALELFAKVAKNNSKTSAIANDAFQRSQGFAKLTLEKSFSIIGACDQINSLSPPSAFWGQFRAATSRGPPSFDLYYFIYGVMDCASRIGRMLSPHIATQNVWPDVMRIVQGLRSRLIEVVLRSEEPTYRWKALEFLSSISSSPRQLKYEMTEVAMIDPITVNWLTNEIDATFESLQGGSAIYPQVPMDVSGDGGAPELSPPDWDEHPFDPPPVDDEATLYSITLHERGYQWAGLAPNCKSAVFLKTKSVYLYSLAKLGETKEQHLIAKLSSKNTLLQIALSNEYIATISKHQLKVAVYNEYQAYDIGYVDFDSERDGLGWAPSQLAIHDAKGRTWIAVGGQIYHDGRDRGCIKMYEVKRGKEERMLNRHLGASFSRPSPDPLMDDQVKALRFSPNGLRLICLTQNNRVLIWFLSNNARPRNAPFQIKKQYAPETGVDGIQSATMFLSPCGKPYVLCTTSPSSERNRFLDEEWSFICPVAESPAKVPQKLFHNIQNLGKAGAILAGAVSPAGDLVAVMEDSGKIFVFPLASDGRNRGLRCDKKIKLRSSLCTQELVSTMALRFCTTEHGLCLYAVDVKGRFLFKRFEGTDDLTPTSSHRRSIIPIRPIGTVQS